MGDLDGAPNHTNCYQPITSVDVDLTQSPVSGVLVTSVFFVPLNLPTPTVVSLVPLLLSLTSLPINKDLKKGSNEDTLISLRVFHFHSCKHFIPTNSKEFCCILLFI